jgi:hypothetical protein
MSSNTFQGLDQTDDTCTIVFFNEKSNGNLNLQEAITRNEDYIDDKLISSSINESARIEPSGHFCDDMFSQWIGRVITINDDETFIASIDSPLKKTSKKIVHFNTKKSKIINASALQNGAVFYWTVGMYKQTTGVINKCSEIRFNSRVQYETKDILNQLDCEIKDLVDGITWLE